MAKVFIFLTFYFCEFDLFYNKHSIFVNLICCIQM